MRLVLGVIIIETAQMPTRPRLPAVRAGWQDQPGPPVGPTYAVRAALAAEACFRKRPLCEILIAGSIYDGLNVASECCCPVPRK